MLLVIVPTVPPSGCVEALVALGFAGLEAEVYTHLAASDSPQTGYSVAKAIGKPVANTYKAIESLRSRGAVLVEDGEHRACRAVPPGELLRQIQSGFVARAKAAAKAFSGLQAAAGDDRVYTLRSRDQVLERTRSMLTAAERVILVDAFPRVIDDVRQELVAAMGRGVVVAVKTYAEVDLPVTHLHIQPDGEEVIARWPGSWLNVVVDGAEHLLSLLAPDGESVHHAVWSRSSYLSWVYHSSVAAEIVLSAVQAAARDGRDPSSILGLYDVLATRDAPGYQELIRRFGGPTPDAVATSAPPTSDLPTTPEPDEKLAPGAIRQPVRKPSKRRPR